MTPVRTLRLPLPLPRCRPPTLRRTLTATATVLAWALAAAQPAGTARPAAAAGSTDVQRWDLRPLYATPAAWAAAFEALRPRVEALSGLQAGFGGSAGALRSVLVNVSEVQRELTRLYVYASLLGDEDLRIAVNQERVQQVQALYTRFSEQTAWLAPAVQALGAERVRGFLAADATLRARFDFQLEEMLRNAPHTLSPQEEALLAAAAQPLSQPGTVFQLLVESELPKPRVRLAGGRSVVLDQPTYEAERASPNRADRKKVFDAFFGSLKAFEGTLGANLGAQVQANVFQARARRFPTALDAALFGDAMPPAVYRTLVAQAGAALPTLHRYLRLRQRALGIPGRLAYHDNYPPLVRAAGVPGFDLRRSAALTRQALAPMGPAYLALLDRSLQDGRLDSHPRPGKAAGGYMSGAAYDVHPYLLLNHTGDFQSLSTLAHEAGHAVHTLLSNAAQPYEKSGYSTFIAESASIANEMLLSDHVVAAARSRSERMFYLAQALESIRTTFFRQVQFAEFQLALHTEVEAGRPLSGARISQLYCEVARRYYGAAEGVMDIDPLHCLEWAYVSHFYRGFYVWQYASSMVGAAAFADAIAREGAPARDRFLALLQAGSSASPYPLVVQAGVDLAQPAPYQALVTRMNRLMDEFEALAAGR